MTTLRETSRITRGICRQRSPWQLTPLVAHRCASTSAVKAELSDLERGSSLAAPGPDDATVQAFNTAKRTSDRPQQLPGNRYQYHPPKFDRGPLHPIQSPPSTDPTARDFVPGPFNIPRLRQTYDAAVASDLLTLTYLHKPPGTPEREVRERLRAWDDSSPYNKNRPLRGPRGGSKLDLLEKNINWRRIPEIKAVSLHAFMPASAKVPGMLQVARSVIQSISGNCPEVTKTKNNVVQWKIREGDKSGVKTTMYGYQAHEFLDKLINIVLPKIKDWPGVNASTGDGNGGLAFGLKADDLAWFPELQINYDMYPAKLLPGCHIFVQTTATSNRQARLLLQSLGLPFYGKFKD
ncbi:54S ribosomal protein L7, mitochondrial [Colletotrichum tanaceti]|uniref:54S ribosomal protein L7, mitochondrial n=1 Tax=Colletotrichum tanaceti TaxID=1306861 RepID=A0A4U6XPC1_9PEZI|nr:54S ribosomal protein L7, mitochondrial [Colletotrichum tanaceti]TKW57591.1 54S ribosomal protein L7, mitochondrial [Colletotrichum tanaceti]